MYIATHSENVLKSVVFNENQLVSKRNNVIIPAPSYARRSGHRHCPPAYRWASAYSSGRPHRWGRCSSGASAARVSALFRHDRKLLFHTWAKVEYSSWILCFFPQNTNVCRNCFACDKYNRFPMILQAFPIAPSPLTYYDNIAKYTHRKNVNSTIQGLYQYSRWYGSFFIYLLLKERRFSPCRFSISLYLYRYLGFRQRYLKPFWWCALVLHVGCCACPGDCLRFHSAPLWRWWPQKLNHNIQLKGGVPMTGEGILFCFSMLFSLCIS